MRSDGSAVGRRREPSLKLGKKWRTWLAALLVGAAAGCAVGGSGDLPRRAAPNFLSGYPAMPAPGLVHVVVEIPAGTNAKWEVAKDGSSIEWELEDGEPRVVAYLAYPANYGMIPGTLLPRESGGDGDPLDAVLLGPALERGSVAVARPIGALLLLDEGERDDKVLAVPTAGPLSDARDLADLRKRYPGVLAIIETWFTHYKGPDRLASRGLAGRAEALRIIEEASAYYGAASGATPSR
jgi:inorganic pyrophosphatase